MKLVFDSEHLEMMLDGSEGGQEMITHWNIACHRSGDMTDSDSYIPLNFVVNSILNQVDSQYGLPMFALP